MGIISTVTGWFANNEAAPAPTLSRCPACGNETFFEWFREASGSKTIGHFTCIDCRHEEARDVTVAEMEYLRVRKYALACLLSWAWIAVVAGTLVLGFVVPLRNWAIIIPISIEILCLIPVLNAAEEAVHAA